MNFAEERFSKLMKATDRLVKLVKKRDHYFSCVSHELRTPLHVIMAHAEALTEGMMGELNHEQQQAIGKIFQATDALSSIVNDLLDISKLEAGSMHLRPVEVEYESLIESVVDMVHPLAAKKNITLAISLVGKVGVVFADPDRTEQVLRNLLSNAIKFTPEGGQITVQVEEGYPANNLVVTSVKDSGIGIPKEGLKQIFDPFFQVDQQMTRSKGGTGLGLAICKSLVEQMGGTIHADSEEGIGSTFSFELPVHDRRKEPRKEIPLFLM